jgi:hypothetical protein
LLASPACSFLGIDPELPAGHLGHSNTRANRLGHEVGAAPLGRLSGR